MRVLKQRKTEGGRRLGAVRHARNAERVKIHVTKGDSVRVMRGEDKGKEGKVLKVFPKTGRVTVEGVNIVKRHRKARRPEEQSGIVEMAAPIHASNVMLLDPKSGQPTRARTRIDEDASEAKASRRKERISAKSGDAIPYNR
jgi:large subunit ribosomal protein L24